MNFLPAIGYRAVNYSNVIEVDFSQRAWRTSPEKMLPYTTPVDMQMDERLWK